MLSLCATETNAELGWIKPRCLNFYELDQFMHVIAYRLAGYILLVSQLQALFCFSLLIEIMVHCTTRILEMLGRFLNLNKIKNKILLNQESIFFSQKNIDNILQFNA